MSFTISGTFGGANGGVSGAVVTAWKATRFLTAPVEGSTPPSGTPTGGPVTSGPDFGSAGAWQVEVASPTSYWISSLYNDVRFWSLYPVNTIENTVASVFGRTGAVTAQSGDYTATKISGLGTAAKKNAGTATGVASLNVLGKIPSSELPNNTVLSVFGRTGVVAAQSGDYSAGEISGLGTAATRNAGSATGVASLNNTGKVPATQSQVASVFGRTGVIVGGATDYKTVSMKAKSFAATLSGSVGRFLGTLATAPGSGTWSTGDYGVGFHTTHVVVIYCSAGGTPGTWRTGSITPPTTVTTATKWHGVSSSGTPASGKIPVASSATAAVWTTPSAAIPGLQLGLLQYDPTSNVTLTRSSTVLVQLTATHLGCSFVAPASGHVMWRFQCLAAMSTGAVSFIQPYITTIGFVGKMMIFIDAVPTGQRYTMTILVTGLTPGTTYTIQPGYQVGSGTLSIFAGGFQGSILQVVTGA